MFDIIELMRKIEVTAANLEPRMTVCFGLIFVFVGLLCWLAGLKIPKILLSICGIILGVAVCYYFISRSSLDLAISGVIGFGVGLVIGFLSTSSLLSRLIFGFALSLFGSVLVFTGMIFLLKYKGATPVKVIEDNLGFYKIAFGLMVLFGLFEQMLLCPKGKIYLPKEDAESKKK